MKKLFFILFLFLISCSKSNISFIENELYGKWILYNVLCYCVFSSQGNNYYFSNHNISFNNDTVTISNEKGEYNFIEKTGVYNYIINLNTITIMNRSYTYNIKNKSLTLTYIDVPEIADDEVSYYFKKRG